VLSFFWKATKPNKNINIFKKKKMKNEAKNEGRGRVRETSPLPLLPRGDLDGVDKNWAEDEDGDDAVELVVAMPLDDGDDDLVGVAVWSSESVWWLPPLLSSW
jgi:hypothetical protein